MPVTTKVSTVTPMMRPARRTLRIPAMAPAMEENTSGTTTQNMRLMKICPSGRRVPAAAGHSQPVTPPVSMAASMAPRSP